MTCLMKFKWVKLRRDYLPVGKGIMGYWARLASRVAFRKGKAFYCGHVNEIEVGEWVGGIMGLKSILGVSSKQKAFEIMNKLSELGYIEYTPTGGHVLGLPRITVQTGNIFPLGKIHFYLLFE